MEKDFIVILKKLVKEQGKKALTDYTKCKSFLRDYAKNEFKKEIRFILLAVEEGTAKTIDKAENLETCKKAQINKLQEDQGLAPEIAANVVNALALVLRGDKTITKVEMQNTETAKETAAKEHIKRGMAYYDKKKYDMAIREFTEAINIDPNASYLALVYYKRGKIHEKFNDYDQAITDYTVAIQLNPKYADAYRSRGLNYDARGKKHDIDRAFADFNTAIQLNPNDWLAYSGRGDVYEYKGCYDLAIEDFSAALQLNPKDGLTYRSRGRTYLRKGDIDHAIVDFDTALRLINNTNIKASIYFRRGEAYMVKRDFDRAIVEFEAYLNLVPNDPEVTQLLEEARQKR